MHICSAVSTWPWVLTRCMPRAKTGQGLIHLVQSFHWFILRLCALGQWSLLLRHLLKRKVARELHGEITLDNLTVLTSPCGLRVIRGEPAVLLLPRFGSLNAVSRPLLSYVWVYNLRKFSTLIFLRFYFLRKNFGRVDFLLFCVFLHFHGDVEDLIPIFIYSYCQSSRSRFVLGWAESYLVPYFILYPS